MWSFSKKARFPGVIEHPDGTIEFSLSEDEAEAADFGLSNFRDVLLHPNHAERVQNGLTAVALSHYVQNLVDLHCSPSTEAEYRKNRRSIEHELRKAVADKSRRKIFIQQQLHATKISDFRSRSAANAKQARMSSSVRYGKSRRISVCVIPDARYPSTSPTVIRRPRMQGFPLRLPGSIVMIRE